MSYTAIGIGIDFGASNIKAAAVSENGDLLAQSACETVGDSINAWAETIKEIIKDLEDRCHCRARWIGLATPGFAAPDSLSIASVSGRLRDLEGIVWTDLLQVGKPVPVLNDAHAALLGEAWKGAASGYQDLVLLTLGTGVGGAIIADGRLLKGYLGRSGHLGHICLNPDGPPDIINTPGSLEDAIGNRTLATRSQGRFISTHQLVEAHLAGDAGATAIWLRSVYQLACGITSIINVLDPQAIILGGGIAKAGPALLVPLQGFLDRIEWRLEGRRVEIITATLGDLAGTLGAAYNAMHWMENR